MTAGLWMGLCFYTAQYCLAAQVFW